MANWIGAILTEKGRNLHAKVETGEVLLTITKMKIGDGILPPKQSLEKLTDLISPRKNLGIVTKEYMGDGLCKISAPLTNDDVEEGYYLRELGLFANDPNEGDILYAVTMDSNPDYLPAKTSQTSIFKDLNMYIAISNAESIEIKVDLEGVLSVKNAGIIIDDKIFKHDESDDAHEKVFNGYVKSVVENQGTVTVTKGSDSTNTFTVLPTSHNNDPAAHPNLSGVPIGTIIQCLGNEAPKGFLELNGIELRRDAYTSLWEYAQEQNPISDTTWQSLADEQNGTVAKFSLGNGSTTFRLPCLNDFTRPKGNSGREVGDWFGDAIRNIEGVHHGFHTVGHPLEGVFSFENVYQANIGMGGSQKDHRGASVHFNLDGVVPVAEENRPKNVTVLYCIKAYDTPINHATVDVEKALSEMNKKVSYADFTQSFSENGWTKLPNGLILQWGTSDSIGTDVQVVMKFPISFNVACLNVTATMKNAIEEDDDVASRVLTYTNTSVTLRAEGITTAKNGTRYISYFAIGY